MQPLGIPPVWIDWPPGQGQYASTPNTAKGTGTGWNRHPPTGTSESSRIVVGVETLGKPRRSVRGGPQPCCCREGTAGRPQARRCRGRQGRSGPQGPGRTSRTRLQPGPGHAGLLRHRRVAAAAGRVTGAGVSGRTGFLRCRRALGGPVRLGPAGGWWSSRARGRGLTGRPGPGQSGALTGPAPGACRPTGRLAGWKWNDRSGSEELTGSPGGYSEPFPRPGCGDRHRFGHAGSTLPTGTDTGGPVGGTAPAGLPTLPESREQVRRLGQWDSAGTSPHPSEKPGAGPATRPMRLSRNPARSPGDGGGAADWGDSPDTPRPEAGAAPARGTPRCLRTSVVTPGRAAIGRLPEGAGMLHDRNTRRLHVANMFRWNPPAIRARLLPLMQTTRSGSMTFRRLTTKRGTPS